MSDRAYYKNKMNEYKKSKETLEDYETNLNDYMDNCVEKFKEFYNVYQAEANLQGEVMDNFNALSEDLYDEVKLLFIKIEEDISIINNKKNRAYDLYVENKNLYEAACNEKFVMPLW